MIKLEMEETLNGFVLDISGSVKNNGKYVFRYLDIIKLIEFFGRLLLDKPVEVREK